MVCVFLLHEGAYGKQCRMSFVENQTTFLAGQCDNWVVVLADSLATIVPIMDKSEKPKDSKMYVFFLAHHSS